MISIHPPRGGRDQARDIAEAVIHISIHPPRGGRDKPSNLGISQNDLFQSTRPVGGGTRRLLTLIWICGFQSTRPVGGGTPTATPGEDKEEISIHPPRGGRDRPRWMRPRPILRFQSTRPVGGGTDFTPPETVADLISIHPPRGGRDSNNSQIFLCDLLQNKQFYVCTSHSHSYFFLSYGSFFYPTHSFFGANLPGYFPLLPLRTVKSSGHPPGGNRPLRRNAPPWFHSDFPGNKTAGCPFLGS